MKFNNDTNPKSIVADEGKHIRLKDDVYKEAHKDEHGFDIEEHFPHYSTIIYVPDIFTEEHMNELYIEEDIK